jgi:hypothetical protein
MQVKKHTKKHFFLGLILIALVIAGLSATAWAGAKQSSVRQWEYANYSTLTVPGSERVYRWSTPYEVITDSFDYNDSDSGPKFWSEAGFKFGYKEVGIADWLNYLGRQGWELVDVTFQPRGSMDYWFKRPKQ